MTTPRELVVWSLTRLRHPNDPHRQRIDAERVAALAADIAANGLLNPILIRGPLPDGTAEVIAGDRRTYAFEYLKRRTIEAFMYPPDTDPLDIRASENLHQEQLDPVEQGRIARRYVEQGMPLAHVAAKMGHTREWVQARLDLLKYPAELREAVAAGQLPLAVAAQLVEIDHDGVRQQYVAEAIRSGATSRTVAVWLAHWRNDGARMAANHAAVEAIIADRESYVIHVECEGCHATVPLLTTRTLRFCATCLHEIADAAQRAT